MDNRTRKRVANAEREMYAAINEMDQMRKLYAKIKDSLRKIAEEFDIFEPGSLDDQNIQQTINKIMVAIQLRGKNLQELKEDNRCYKVDLEAKSEELARVWYMLRTITGDSTLRRDLNEQVDHTSTVPGKYVPPTPFDRPKY